MVLSVIVIKCLIFILVKCLSLKIDRFFKIKIQVVNIFKIILYDTYILFIIAIFKTMLHEHAFRLGVMHFCGFRHFFTKRPYLLGN